MISRGNFVDTGTVAVGGVGVLGFAGVAGFEGSCLDAMDSWDGVRGFAGDGGREFDFAVVGRGGVGCLGSTGVAILLAVSASASDVASSMGAGDSGGAPGVPSLAGGVLALELRRDAILVS